MPPNRDEQSYETKRQQIIDGALQVFSTKGFEKATNKDIARASGIGSPGLIYHYFKDKTDLFRQVMEERTPILQLLSHSDEMMDLPPKEVLTLFGNSFVKTFHNRAAVPMFKLILSEAVRRPMVADIFNRIGPGKGFAFMVAYLNHQMDLGTLRRTDAGAAVRCFLGPLLAYMLTTEVFVQPDASSLSPETMVQVAVDVFLNGMQVDYGR